MKSSKEINLHNPENSNRVILPIIDENGEEYKMYLPTLEYLQKQIMLVSKIPYKYFKANNRMNKIKEVLLSEF